MRTRITAILAAVAAIALTACGSGSTTTTSAESATASAAAAELSQLLAGIVEEAQAGADQALDPNSGVLAVEVVGSESDNASRVTTIYTIDTASDPNAATPGPSREEFAAGYAALSEITLDSYRDGFFPLLEADGLTGVLQAEDVYLDENGELLWSQVYMQDLDRNVCAFDSVPLEESPTSCADVQ